MTTLQLGVLDEATVYQKPVVTIQGQTYPVQTVKDAIEILMSAPGSAVKTPLKQAGNALGLLTLTTLTEGSLFDEVPPDGLKPAKGKTRRHVISRLQKLLDGAQQKISVGNVIKVKEPAEPPAGKLKPIDDTVVVAGNGMSVEAIDLVTAMVDSGDQVELDEDCEEVPFPEPEEEKCAYGYPGCDCSSAPRSAPVTTQRQKLPAVNPQPATPPTYTKIGLFEYNDQTSYAKYPSTDFRGNVDDGFWDLIFKQVKEYTGNVMLAGQTKDKCNYDEKMEWCLAFYNGDLHRCWTIEKTKGEVHPDHPGAPDADTRHLIWEPEIYGELPAGVLPPGDWPATNYLGSNIVDNYIIAAKMHRPETLHSGLRQSWVTAHLTGSKVRVDSLSAVACSDRYAAGESPAHTPGLTFPNPNHEDMISKGKDPEYWSVTTLDQYLTANPDCVPASTFYRWKVQAVQEHIYALRTAEARKDLELQLTVAPDQPKLSGYHTKLVLLDQDQRRWLFKPAAEGRRFRADVEHHAHVVARHWGYRTAPSHLVEHDGTFGQLQRLFDVAHDLAGWTGKDLLKLTTEQLGQLVREHVLDWALDNDDTHGENIVATTNGDLVGIDKGRAWRYYGSWNGLIGDSRANSNCQLIYTVLYDAIAAGLFEQTVVDHLYRDALAQAHRMTTLPDDDLRAIITAAQEHRPHYNPPSYTKPHPLAPADLAQLLDAAVTRKNNLPNDIQQLWANVYQRAGWTLPDPNVPSPPGLNAQGHRLHAGMHSPELHEAITLTSSYGTSTFVTGTHIEDAHVLLWREKHATKGMQLRGHFKLRAGAEFEAVRAYCRARAGSIEELVGPKGQPFSPEYAEDHKLISAAATAVNRDFGQSAKKNFPIMGSIRSKLRTRLKELQAVTGPDPDQAREAELRIIRTYIGYCLRIEEACQYPFVTFSYNEMPPMNFNPPKPVPENDTVTVKKVRCRRVSSGMNGEPKFDNGELVVASGEIADTGVESRGQAGSMYLVTLATGETIEFRADEADGVFLSAHGTVEFTASAEDIPAALQHIAEQLVVMGCPLDPATDQDLELFYWRHLVGIIGDRVDSKRGAEAEYKPFWKAVDAVPANATDQEAITGLRAAFATLTSAEQITNFTAGGGHLPRFMHLNLRHPTTPSGKPFWERFDVTAADWNTKGMPVVHYRSGPIRAAKTGACLSTAARTRALGIWKPGMSSAADLSYGSGTFVFIRQNQVDPKTYRNWGILFNRRVLARTSNYAFPGDGYGRISSRSELSHWNFASATGHYGGANELMVKDALSVLDDTEMLIFNDRSHLISVIAYYRQLGITEIRGNPIRWRLRFAEDWSANQLILRHLQEQLGNP